ncbi:MAG: potassium channel beta subunit family protein [Acidimicrobiales bacterium]
MEYRRLGRSGLKVSVLSFGSWVTFGPQLAGTLAEECLTAARDAGVNFFDNAEAYAGGESERIMGQAIASLGWPRRSYVISTKLFWGIHGDVNMNNTLNRKYLLLAIDGSLERFGLDFVDLVYCHRPDPETPIEETVRAMSDIITSGKALYWGTSEWSAEQLRCAWDVADRHHLHKPVVEQPQYNLFWRRRVEKEYAPLYDDIGLGLTTYSPLSSGLLSGKYLDEVPEGSRATLPGYEWLGNLLTSKDSNAKVRSLKGVADGLGCTLSQLSIAWVAKNPKVSSVITGASRVGQVKENMGALDVMDRLTDDVTRRIDEIFAAERVS